MAGCLPYENVDEAVNDPNEASFAFGTLNGMAWEANWDINATFEKHRGKISVGVYGVQEFSGELYWDIFSISDAPWLASVSKVDLNSEQYEDLRVRYHVVEYDVSVARYELDKTQENYLKMSPMWGSADYTGELEVHLVKTWSVDYAPPTPDTLHLVVEEFRATHVK